MFENNVENSPLEEMSNKHLGRLQNSLGTVLRSNKHLEQQVARTVPQDQLAGKIFQNFKTVLRTVRQGVCSNNSSEQP